MSKLIKTIMVMVSCAGLLLTSIISTNLAHAEEKKPPNLADMWIIMPKAGQWDDFDKAFKKHLKFRKDKGDSRDWQTYAPVVGDDLSFYAVRFCCTRWNEVDAYVKWNRDNKVGEHWNKYVDKYVEKYEHYYSRIDFANSHWPKDGGEFSYFGVRNYKVKMGQRQSVEATKKMLSDYAKEMKWPYYWSWSQNIGGSEHLNLVFPFKDYADMTPPDKTYGKALAEHLGDKEKVDKLFADWSKNFKWSKYTIYRHVEDMSMKAKK